VRVQARRVPLETAARTAVDVASGLLGARRIVVGGVDYGEGCAALVRAAYAGAGVTVEDGDAASLHVRAAAEGRARRFRPAAGDLVFLADRPGGPPEHVGLVERVAPDGTVLVLHRMDSGVVRVRLNASQPWKARTDEGKTLNDVLIVGAGRVTVARLLVAYAGVH
jgi:cell wall-associated NlpC family hydrolase